MKSLPGLSHFLGKNLLLFASFLIVMFSCTKSTDNPMGPTQINYCTTIDWSNNSGQSGSFTGDYVDGIYFLKNMQYTENGIPGGFPLHYDANNHLINDQPGVIYTYSGDTLTNFTIVNNSKGNGTYNFDSKGRLIGGVINLTESGMTGTVTGTYFYDSNDDPVKFSASGTLSTPDGPISIDLEVTGDFLTDKASLLPFQPEFAPASSFFSIIPFTSRHLLNKWNVSYSGTGFSTKATLQYTYTFDTNGNVATMVHTGNSSIIYTFDYSGCK